MKVAARWGRHLVVVAAALMLAMLSRQGLPGVTVNAPSAAATTPPAEAVIAVMAPHAFPPATYPLIRFPIGPDTDLRTPSGLTVPVIEQFLRGSRLAGLGPAFLDAEERAHVNARYLIAHAIEESAWGGSDIARDKNNLYGYGAVDWNPYGAAMSFPDMATDIRFQAQMVARDYLSPGGPHWGGAPTLNGMHHHYATDPHWVQRILTVAALIPG